ncbi:MAG: carboxy-S-adenosyl-L-methionine synthase CmoA, partial [Halieaceae bacterium]
MSDTRDTIYAEPLADPGLFAFDDNVARVFPDMIKRSVPGYPTIVAMTGLLAARYASPGSTLYDLGCSLGASTLAMRQNLQTPDCRIVAVDNASEMLQRCKTLIDTDTHDTPVELVCAPL